MARHLISATLTPEAYEWYEVWSKDRKGSEMLSKCIVAHASGFHEYESTLRWKKTRLVELIRAMIQLIPPSRWKRLREEDRISIDLLAKPSREYSNYQMGDEE